MQWLHRVLLVITSCLFLAACDDGSIKHTDTLSSGMVDISVDETYRPIIEEQIKVFESSYKDAKINAHYKPESECIKDLFENKAHLILVTRDLSKIEKQLCEQKQIVPTTLPIARDAVAVIVNPSSPDSLLNVAEIKGILTGVYKKKYTVVVDNEGSSTVRYILDSLLPGKQLGANVYAAKGNAAVVDYVAANPDAIGFIGFSYVNDPTDSTTQSFLKKVKVASLYHDTAQLFYPPLQAFIAAKLYPLTRAFYYINRETYSGLGSGFANFLAGNRGQLIFKQAFFLPLRANIVIRDVNVNP